MRVSGTGVLSLGAVALVVSASAGCSNKEKLRFGPIALDGPITASIVQNNPESTGIKIEGAKILPSPLDVNLAKLNVTLAVQDLHNQDTAPPITVTLNSDKPNHIVVIQGDRPGYLDLRFVNNCPNDFPNPIVAQGKGLAGILTQLGADAGVAKIVQTQLMVKQTNEGLAYSGSKIKGYDLTAALKTATKSLIAEFAPDKTYIVHQYRFDCQDANGKSQPNVSETTYNFVFLQGLGRQ